MSARLVLASVWLPPWIVRRELEGVERATVSALERLLGGDGAAATPDARRKETIAEGRRRMAVRHADLIARLLDARGRDAAIAEARAALYAVGVLLGRDARARLRVRGRRRDLVRAAGVLYRVLGIRFRAEWTTTDTARVEIGRCALSREYSPDTCRVLSAADAGVVAGLWPGAQLEFEERITEGRPACVARLALPATEGEEGA